MLVFRFKMEAPLMGFPIASVTCPGTELPDWANKSGPANKPSIVMNIMETIKFRFKKVCIN
jgi:hypothetical protein